MLIGKRVVDLGLIELFFARCYGWGLRANVGSKSAISLQRGPAYPKFQVEWVARHQPFFSENQAGKIIFRIIVWYKNLDRSFFRFVTMHAFDRRTDRQSV